MIKQKEFARRRRQLMRMAGEDSIIVLQAAPPRIRNNDVYYAYRQDSDFLYLTGFREHSALLVMIPDDGDGKCILFCRSRDPEREMWDGRMAGLGRDPLFDQRLIGWLNEFRGKARKTFHAPEEIHALDHMLHDMRVYKSRDELSAMRRAAKVTIEAHEEAMRGCRPGLSEAHIHAEIGEIAAGLKPGRTDPEQITFFKSVGVAVQDAISGRIALENAIEHNLGMEVSL